MSWRQQELTLKLILHVKACDLCRVLVHDRYRIAEDAGRGRFGTAEE
jgi:hypothetical protein